MKRGLILLSILSILGVASISAKAPQEVNAWQSNGETSDEDLEITFINEEVDDKGSYHYKYHIKNAGQKYIQEFTIRGPFDASNETVTLFTSYEIKNDLFNYRTLLLAPNQETDVDFCVNEIHSQEVSTAFHWLFYKVFTEIHYDPDKRQDYVKMMKRITKQFIKTIILGEVNTTGKALEFHYHSDDGKIKFIKTFYFKPKDLKERIFQPEIRFGIMYASIYYELAKLNYLNQETFDKIYI